jgi:hypothetical protein
MPTPLTLKLVKHLGLVGAADAPLNSLVPAPAQPSALSSYQYQDFVDAGNIADPDIWSRYSSIMKRPVSFDSMLNLWEEMAGWDLMAAALSEVVHEVLQTDSNCPGTLWYECNDAKVEDELNSMLQRVRVEEFLPSQVYHVASLGNSFDKIEYEPQNGVVGLSFAHPMDVRRYWLERNRRCVGFRWMRHKPRKDDAFVGPDNKTPIQRVALQFSGQDLEYLWYPWDFLHLRRLFRLRMTEHGEPLFEEAQGIYKKLRLALDQMVVHRAQVQPDRYVVNIDVKDQAPTEQMRTINRWKQTLRSKLSFGQGTDSFSDPAKFDAFYNAMALDTILWVAKPNGFQHAIEKLPGTANVPDVYDIELLTDLFFSIIGMPKSWFGATKPGENNQAPSGKSLLAQDMRFLRKIKTVRQPIINGYTWLAYFHAALKEYNLDNLDIKAKMSPIGLLEEQMKLELLSAQADVLDKLGDIMQKYNLPREAWVETIFKRYLHMPDDVVHTFLAALPPEVQQESSRKPAPSSFKLLKEVADKLAGNLDALKAVNRLKAVLYGDEDLLAKAEDRRIPRYRNIREVLEQPALKKDDIVVSSYGEDPFKFSQPAHSAFTGKLTESAQGAVFAREKVEPGPETKRPAYLNYVG